MRRAHDNIRWTSADALGSTWTSPGCSFVLWQIRSLSIVPRYADRLYTHTDEPTQSVLLAMHESFCINKASVLTASTSTTPKTLLAERQNISKALPIIGRIQNNQFQVKPNNLWNKLDSKFGSLREFGFDLTKKSLNLTHCVECTIHSGAALVHLSIIRLYNLTISLRGLYQSDTQDVLSSITSVTLLVFLSLTLSMMCASCLRVIWRSFFLPRKLSVNLYQQLDPICCAFARQQPSSTRSPAVRDNFIHRNLPAAFIGSFTKFWVKGRKLVL